MKQFSMQALAAVMVVLLALPQGWCCLAPRLLAKAKQAEPTCCCCQPKSEEPQKKDQSPEPNDPFACCCEPRIMAADHGGTWDVSGDLPVAVLAPLDVSLSTSSQAVFDGAAMFDAGGPPVHVLHCVWRC